MSTKKIVVFSTTGKAQTIETSAVTYSELQGDLKKAGYDTSGMKVVDQKKRTYENGAAEVGDDVTNLFLYPMKTKSGSVTTYTPDQAANLSFSQCRAAISEHIAADEAGAKEHYNVGKNYTTKSTADLRVLVGTYKPKSGGKAPTTSSAPAATTAKVAKAKKEPVKAAEPVKAVAKTKATVKKTEVSLAKPEANVSDVVESVAVVKGTKDLTPDNIVSQLESLLSSGQYDKATIDEAVKAVLKIKVIKPGEVDTDALAKMAREIGAGFNDIKR